MNTTIAVDFDGTCVEHNYPKISKDVPDAERVIKGLVESGFKIILNTMRSGKELYEAVNWFANKDIPLYGINENPTQKEWTISTKVLADIYIDDAALGCPLVFTERFNKTIGYVDWLEVEKKFFKY